MIIQNKPIHNNYYKNGFSTKRSYSPPCIHDSVNFKGRTNDKSFNKIIKKLALFLTAFAIIEQAPQASFASYSQYKNEAVYKKDDCDEKELSFNYEIEPSKQSKHLYDCWLLSVINSLSYTQNGKKIIKNLFEYNTNQVIVNLNNFQCVIDKDEISDAKNKNKYSTGDDDVTAIEIAVEKALDEYNAGNKDILPEKLHLKDTFGNKNSSINYGSPYISCYLLTGNTPKYISLPQDKNKLDKILDDYKKDNKESMIVTASILDEGSEVADINNKKIKLFSKHTYSLVEVKNNYVVLYDSITDSEIKISKVTFKNSFDQIIYTSIE